MLRAAGKATCITAKRRTIRLDLVIETVSYLVLTTIQLAPVKLAAVAPSGLRNRYVLARLPVFRSAKK
jgi:hypothetical protein